MQNLLRKIYLGEQTMKTSFTMFCLIFPLLFLNIFSQSIGEQCYEPGNIMNGPDGCVMCDGPDGDGNYFWISDLGACGPTCPIGDHHWIFPDCYVCDGTDYYTSDLSNCNCPDGLNYWSDPNCYVCNGNGYSVGTPEDCGMPVELVSFAATTTDGKVILNWKTSTEINSYGFEIERSIKNENLDNIRWEVIGFVEGHGNSNSPKEYSFIDLPLSDGKYSYILKQIDNDGTFKYSHSVEIGINVSPSSFALAQNFPNPFNPSTTISFSIPQQEFVSLKIYDILSSQIAVLVDEKLEAGNYHKKWSPAGLSSGVYFYTLKAGKFTETRKMNLLK